MTYFIDYTDKHPMTFCASGQKRPKHITRPKNWLKNSGNTLAPALAIRC